MTLREFQKEKADAKKEYGYYAWACTQSASEKMHQEDLEKRDYYYNLYQKYVKFEEKALTEALKHGTI